MMRRTLKAHKEREYDIIMHALHRTAYMEELAAKQSAQLGELLYKH
jgi:hypothetical protein